MNVDMEVIMTNMSRIFAILGVSLTASTALADGFTMLPGQIHQQLAQDYVEGVVPSQNEYGSPATLDVLDDGTLEATTRCGSFAALMMQHAYPGLRTESPYRNVIKELTTSGLPEAELWYDAIVSQKQTADGKFRLRRATTYSTALVDAAILVSKYPEGSTPTGHVMLMGSFAINSDTVVIPGTAQKVVKVFDSTQTPHWDDTRTDAEANGADDAGMGSGFIRLHVSTTSPKRIVAWQWGGPTSVIYWAEPNAQNPACPQTHTCSSSRPLVAGVLEMPWSTFP
jgi:hypothetical protein